MVLQNHACLVVFINLLFSEMCRAWEYINLLFSEMCRAWEYDRVQRLIGYYSTQDLAIDDIPLWGGGGGGGGESPR